METTVETLSVWVHGAAGRMGRAVAEIAARTEHVRLAGVVELRDGAQAIEWAGAQGLPVARGAPQAGARSVVIDFSQPGGVAPLVAALEGSNMPLVCGTTGLGGGERDLLDVYSKGSPVFYAENMSYGICLLAKLLRETAPFLTPFDSAEIVEFHHRHKRDCPSGTALALADAIDSSAAARSGRSRPRETTGNHVTIHSVRAGGIPGTHEVHFAAEEEVLTFTHRALSRDVFAHGAIRAARFIADKKRGLFGMNNLVEHMNG